jgi:hypothetical protein
MRAYVREEMALHVVGFYWSSFTRKNTAERVRENCDFGLNSSPLFRFSARFFAHELGAFARAGHGRSFRAGDRQNEGAERAQWICTVEKSCERIIFSNFASIRNRQLLLKIN